MSGAFLGIRGIVGFSREFLGVGKIWLVKERYRLGKRIF